jgi:hypothetical protein
VNLLGDNIVTTYKYAETSTYVSKEIGLEASIGKIKYMLVSHHQECTSKLGHQTAKRFFLNVSGE